ncbi:MAG: hypothetical protein ACLUSP_01685 [Christensenellales bacterium]
MLLGGDARVGFIMKKSLPLATCRRSRTDRPPAVPPRKVPVGKTVAPVLYVSPSETFFAGAQLYRNTLS